jgi:DNA-binding YbaB/EbfC family protein
MDELLSQMQRLQAELAQAEAATAREGVVGTSGGGAVRISLSGEFSFDAVAIDPAVVAAGDPTVIEDLVLAALRDGAARLRELRQRAMGDAVGNVLGSLFGAGGDGFAAGELRGGEDSPPAAAN